MINSAFALLMATLNLYKTQSFVVDISFLTVLRLKCVINMFFK